MSIDPAFQPENLQESLTSIPFIDPKTGCLTQYGKESLEALRSWVNGANRLIPCSASGTANAIILTPNPVHPLIEQYFSYDTFVFRAALSSTGAVTAAVARDDGNLAALKVYTNPGLVQAGNGDVVAGGTYQALFCDHLDGGAGGFVLK